MTLAANRIVAGDGFRAWELAGPGVTAPALAALLAALAMGLLGARPMLRIAGAALGLGALVWLLTLGSANLLDGAGPYARVSPGAGFWCLLLVLALLLADGLTQLSPGPWARIGILTVALALVAAVLMSGLLSPLSVMQEFASRQSAFFDALSRHLWLSLGSLGVAALIGLPLGIACYRRPPLQDMLLPALSFLQTIPSLAMFGIMIPLLGWVGDTVPGAQAIGIAGIGFAPAFVALVLYSLLPVVANTVAGLSSTPPAAQEAARGMGMTFAQRLIKVELPLGLPIILAGLRIVLVQNIGLAVIAGLIGGGGFGTFVFQGLNQTATDLILLGALPVVALAVVAGVVMDILVALTQPQRRPAPKGTP
ncbi:ABC transporter permease [Loktanella salsilacus]|uniref:ABC transporter permease n=1 Tax=Loktanella salsilacus TaxID=195913 RepID=UPI003734F0B9